MIEALAAGTPVVLPQSGAFPEIVEDTQGGVIYENNDPPSLAQSIERLLDNPERGKKMGLHGHREVIQKYSNDTLAKSLIDNILAPALTNS